MAVRIATQRVKINWRPIPGDEVSYDVVSAENGEILQFDFRRLQDAEMYAIEQGWEITR